VDGSYAARQFARVKTSWDKILPQRVIHLTDPSKLSETIVSTIELVVGRDRDSVVSSWDASTALVVAEAVKTIGANKGSGGLRRLR
jgi:hypothetical protein